MADLSSDLNAVGIRHPVRSGKVNIRTVHRTSAVIVGTYAAAHVTNHLLGLGGVAMHQAVMDGLRHVYRFPLIEALLLLSVTVQVVTGLWMFFAGLRRRKGAVGWLQAVSGLLLSIFLSLHVAGIFFGRYKLHLDTNIFYAAAGMQLPTTRGFFGPYYFIGVLALFVHVGCALYRMRQRGRDPAAPPDALKVVGGWAAAGAGVALLLVLLLVGVITPVDVPAKYLATFQSPGR